MGSVALGWTGPTIAGGSEIGHALDGSIGKARPRCARTAREFRNRGRNVENNPVPPPASGRRIGVVKRDGETSCAFRCIFPRQLGAYIFPGAAKSIVYLGHGGLAPKVFAMQGKRFGLGKGDLRKEQGRQ